jgi:hypothetical protein
MMLEGAWVYGTKPGGGVLAVFEENGITIF